MGLPVADATNHPDYVGVGTVGTVGAVDVVVGSDVVGVVVVDDAAGEISSLEFSYDDGGLRGDLHDCPYCLVLELKYRQSLRNVFWG